MLVNLVGQMQMQTQTQTQTQSLHLPLSQNGALEISTPHVLFLAEAARPSDAGPIYPQDDANSADEAEKQPLRPRQ